MGLSAFNAMRARMKMEAKALEKGADVEVKEIKPAETSVKSAKEDVVDGAKEPETKKTDAEKLKKKKEV